MKVTLYLVRQYKKGFVYGNILADTLKIGKILT